MIYRGSAKITLVREWVTDKNIKTSLRELDSMQIKSDPMGLQNAFDEEAGQQPQNQQGSISKAPKKIGILKQEERSTHRLITA